jgi:D-alanyl-D-alanine dipeptidase
LTIAHVVAEKDGFILISERISKPDGVRYEEREKFRVRGSSPSIHGLSPDQSDKRQLLLGDVIVYKITPDSDAHAQILITPVRPVSELRTEALAAKPPAEPGNFRKPDLVELAPLDSSIHLEIRYATSNDFLGTPVYSQARAFLQRPAAEALLRVQQKLKPLGYGLLIHDAYRPWYVTKIFWDATPPEGKIFVADPAQGSRHNRGCAVDLTLYDLATGKPIEMPGTYDEMSPRSFPDYPGGTSLQRWHRDLLRRAMESEGFTVYEAEWWHFDYKDWKEYPILNVPFEKLGLDPGTAKVH